VEQHFAHKLFGRNARFVQNGHQIASSCQIFDVELVDELVVVSGSHHVEDGDHVGDDGLQK
jgi:hypothetical protein